MSICKTGAEDLVAIARIHKKQFHPHFLGHYSITLLAALYECFLGNSVFLVHRTASGEIDGFILGGTNLGISAVKNQFVKKNLVRCIWETLLQPSLWSPALERAVKAATSKYPERGGSKVNQAKQTRYTLLSLAVSEKAKGSSSATQLIEAFDEILRKITKNYILSVKKDNSRAICFYEKMGCVCVFDVGESFILKKELSRHRPA